MCLTALSGQHIVIIIFMAFAVFNWLFNYRRKSVFLATFLLIFLFVAMTGFTASAVRAAIMAFLASLSLQAGRIYSPRNSIALAAFLITLNNPKAPVFDLGLQLSFAATMGIIYLSPIIKRLSFFENDGVFGWRTILSLTLAAQVGVAPITIMNFTNFSFTSLPANIALLVIMPVLLPLAFITVAVGSVVLPLGMILAKLTAFLLDYSNLIIEFFSEAKLSFNPSFGWITALIYYIILIVIYWRFYPRRTHTHKVTLNEQVQ